MNKYLLEKGYKEVLEEYQKLHPSKPKVIKPIQQRIKEIKVQGEKHIREELRLHLANIIKNIQKIDIEIIKDFLSITTDTFSIDEPQQEPLQLPIQDAQQK